jgi:hypothetical protein
MLDVIGAPCLSRGVMSLPSQASIRIHTKESEWRFDWRDFEGDDCFQTFEITVVEEGRTRHYDFGACVVQAVRKLNRFFEDPTQATVGGGFRNPDIRYYDLHRSPDQYRLVVRFEGNALHDEFVLSEPQTDLDAEFCRRYYGTKT